MTKNLFLVVLLFFISIVGFGQSIKGEIKDANGLTLPGASVIIDGTTHGTVTNINGLFEIKDIAAGEYILNINFLGFIALKKAVTVGVGEFNVGALVLIEDIEKLDEFVVVGYGVQRKREVTGTISRIDGKTLSELPVPSFQSALQGQAAGVQVTTGSGMAGSSAVIRVRGVASISASGDPLYVIDGIPVSQDAFLTGNEGGFNSNPLAFLNPNDIESIEILKDAASTGIYGSRGSNGVILVTTKRGKSDEMKIDFSANSGSSTPTALPNMLETDEYLQLYQEAWENDGNTGQAELPNNVSWEDAENTNTNWVDETIRIGIKQNYNLGISKSKGKFGYYLNGSYDDNTSYLVGNSYERMSARANLDYKPTDKLKLGLTASMTKATNDRVDAAWSGGFGAAMSTALPIYPVFDDSTGEYTQGVNPVRNLEYVDWVTTEYHWLSGLNVNYQLAENLFLIANGNYEYVDIKDDKWEDGRINPSVNSPGFSDRNKTFINNYNYNAVLDFQTKITDDDKLKLMAGYEYQYSQRIWGYTSSQFSNARIDQEFETDSSILFYGDMETEESSFRSVFGRANYIFKGKYIVQATFRVDGSSKFGPNNKYGYFPSGSFGWLMSDEDFFDVKFMNFLKLKASFGITGNSNIGINAYQQTFNTSNLEDGNGYGGNGQLWAENLDNPDLKWETSNTLDLGAEFGLFEDRVHGEVTFYNKNTTDVLMFLNVPQAYGFDNYWDNVGSILNRGIEFGIKSKNFVGNFKWTTEFNIAHNRNAITSIGDYSEDAISGGTNDTRIVVGSPVGTNFLVRYVGVDPVDGAPIYLDIDGIETKDWDPADRVAVGDVLPDVVGGFTNSFGYGNWDMTVLFYYSIGGKIYDSSSKRQLGVVTDWNMRTDIYDRWKQPGDEAKYPRLTLDTETYGSPTPWINTDLWLHDASYVRLRRLALGYAFNAGQLKGSKFNSIRIGASATNLFVITAYPGLDPEIARDFENAADRNMSAGITYLTPPQEKTFNIHLSISF